jgi:hypothetical protein
MKQRKGTELAHTSTPWSRLAARTARGVLARKDFSFAQLADSISLNGIPETPRGADSKIHRGTYSLAYFLAMLHVVGAEFPLQWSRFVDSDESWEMAAKHIFLHEIKTHGLSIEDLSVRLEAHGVSLRPDKVAAQLANGELPFTAFLQLALVVPVSEFTRFVDRNDLMEAARPEGSIASS